MNDKSIRIKRKQASFLLFYSRLFIFSILVAIVLSLMIILISSIKPDLPGIPSQDLNLSFFIENFSIGLPTYIFIGALGLTHYVQKNQYYFYRNQGCTIKFLIIASWAANCIIGGLLLILSNIVGKYG